MTQWASNNKEVELTACLFLLSRYLFCNHDQTEGLNPDQNPKHKRPCQLHHCFLLEQAERPLLHIPGTWIISVVITLQYLIHHQPVNIDYNLIRKCEGPFAGDECPGNTGPLASPHGRNPWGSHTGLQGSRTDLTRLVCIPHITTSKPRSQHLGFHPILHSSNALQRRYIRTDTTVTFKWMLKY